MMTHSGGPPTRPPHNPMDPQPFYISSDSQPPPQITQPPHTPQRRTWGQPQPMSFAQQGGGMIPVDPYGQRRQQWGAPNGGAETGQYGGYAPPLPPPPQNLYGAPDHYNNPMVDQWGNPVGPPQQNNGYNGVAGGYQGQYGQYNQQQQPPYSSNSPYGPVAQNNPYNQYTSPNSMQPQTPPGRMNTPFRLHDSTVSNPPRPVPPSTATATSPLATSQPRTQGYSSSANGPNGGSTGSLSAIRRRLSENDPTSPTTVGVAPSYTRQSSRDSIRNSDGDVGPRDSASPSHPPRRLHTSVPAPEEVEMAPQNVSFIDSSTEDDAANPSSKGDLSNRLSRLNITSGSKTYRVLSDDKVRKY